MSLRETYKRHEDAIELTKAYIGLVVLSVFLILNIYHEKRFYTDIAAVTWTGLLMLIFIAGVLRSKR